METVKDLSGDGKEYFFESGKDPSGEIVKNQKKNSLNLADNYYRKNFGMQCYAANPNSLCIYYNGTIVKCTVVFEDKEINKVGQVNSDGTFFIDEEKMSWWVNYELFEKCKECEIYPICYGKKCPNAYLNEDFCNNLKDIYRSLIIPNN